MIGPFAFQPRGTVPARMLPIARRLVEDGHQVFVVLPPYDNPQESGRRTFVDKIPIYNVRLGSGPSVFSHLVTGRRLVEETLKLRPDLVHIFKPRGPSGLAAMFLIARRKFGLRLPIVLDTDDWEGRGGFYDYWRLQRQYSSYQLAFADFQDRWIPPRVDAVTVASRTLETRMWSLGVPRDGVFYVPNGPRGFPNPPSADSMEVIRKRLRLLASPVVLLFTRFEFRPERAVRILKTVRQSVADAKLLVVGEGIGGEEKQLRELAAREDLSGQALFTGWVDYEDLPPYLCLADVAMYLLDDTLLNRSKCPAKLVHLMSLGIPIVADRVGQIAECIENEVSGLLVDAEDDDAFAASLVRVLRDPELRTRLGKNAAERVQTVFNWDRLVSQVKEAYGVARHRAR